MILRSKSLFDTLSIETRLDSVHAGVEGKVLTGCFADITTVTLDNTTEYWVLGPGQHSLLHLLLLVPTHKKMKADSGLNR